MCATKDYSVKQGDTFKGRNLTISQKINDVLTPVDLTGVTIAMQVRENPGTPIVEEWTTDDNTILLTDPTAGKFQIVGRTITGAPGMYKYDLQIVFAPDNKKTYFAGQFIIIEQITEIP